MWSRAPLTRLTSRRSLATATALAGLLATYGTMAALTGGSQRIDAIGFIPWVGLLGFETSALGGAAAAGLAIGLWFAVGEASSSSLGATVRIAALVLVGLGAGAAGRRLRRSEEAERETAALQARLFDATLDGICLTDREGNILLTNATLRQLSDELGMPETGTTPERLLAVADAFTEPERYRQRMTEIAEQPLHASADEFEHRDSGRILRGYTAPILTDRGRFTGRIWTLRDVTADRQLDRLRETFVTSVSHELRSPLTAIVGYLELLRDREAALDETGRSYLEIIRRSTDRLQRLVEDILLVARIEAQGLELALAPVELHEVAVASVEAARPAAAEKGVELRLDLAGAPPVRADAVRIGQVLDNLVSNAIKFTDAGGTITVSVGEIGDEAFLSVADTGVGIPVEEQGRLFSRFFRTSSAVRRAVPGTGLGLVIVRAIVERHGGTVDLASREGEGTTVTVTLPAVPVAAPIR